MSLRILSFLAIVLTGLALAPAGAHLFALPNKINLPQAPYFIVQGIYRGWALLGIVLVVALLANLGCAVLLRERTTAFLLSLGAFVALAANLVIFFLVTFPANQATKNWTEVPADWAGLRMQWEYSHAVNAVLVFVALCLATASVFAQRGE